MRRYLWFFGPLATALVLVMGPGCKSRERALEYAQQTKAAEAKRLMHEAQQLLAQDRHGQAAKMVQQAALLLRNDPEPYVLLFEIRRSEGNAPAAALAIKQAAELKPALEPGLKKQLADMYREEGRLVEAIAVLIELRDAGRLNSMELCALAQLQARAGQTDAAFKTLERVQEADADDPEAKAVEAEILLLSGKELLATRLMDRLLTEHPGLTSARVLRARYFYNRDYLSEASADLARIAKPDEKRREVITLRSAILMRRHQADEAEALLHDALTRNRRDVGLIAQLADAKVQLKKKDEADELVEIALAIRPNSAAARYVQGRVAELDGRIPDAIRAYQDALQIDPTSSAALSHLWPLQRAAGEKVEAMTTLERLVTLKEATINEKVTLSEMYFASKTNLKRAITLVEEAQRRDPQNARYARLRTQLGSRISNDRGVVIIRGKKLHERR